jgi:hypothetical protein
MFVKGHASASFFGLLANTRSVFTQLTSACGSMPRSRHASSLLGFLPDFFAFSDNKSSYHAKSQSEHKHLI